MPPRDSKPPKLPEDGALDPDRVVTTAHEHEEPGRTADGRRIGHDVAAQQPPARPTAPGVALVPDLLVPGAAAEDVGTARILSRGEARIDRLAQRHRRTPGAVELGVGDVRVRTAPEEADPPRAEVRRGAGEGEHRERDERWGWGRAPVRGRVLGGAVVDRGRGAAGHRRVGVRRRAGDDAAGDRAADADLLVTLPVPEVVAVDPSGVAATPAGALGAAGAEPVAEVRAAAVLHAVDVVAGAVAEGRVVGAPPPAGEAARRARVDPVVDGAAELRPPVGAEPARAVGDVVVRRPRGRPRRASGDRDRGADHRRPHEEAAPAGLLLQRAGRLLHQPVGEPDALGPSGR